jgi:hypothetical protein
MAPPETAAVFPENVLSLMVVIAATPTLIAPPLAEEALLVNVQPNRKLRHLREQAGGSSRHHHKAHNQHQQLTKMRHTTAHRSTRGTRTVFHEHSKAEITWYSGEGTVVEPSLGSRNVISLGCRDCHGSS